MNSMTGYGSARAALGRLEVTVQASSVNRKTLDLAISVPDDWRSLEADIAERVRQRAARGRISLTVKADLPADSGGAAIDADFVTRTVAELARIAGTQSVEFRATPELLWSIAASQRGRIELPEAEVAGPVVSMAVEEALKGFFAMRAQEGAALLVDLLARVDSVAKSVAEITAAVPRVVPAYRELLLTRLRQAGLELELSDERVLKEVAIFADRCDVSEELTRLQSHLAQLRALFAEEGAVGRKSEFIMQEVGRELNTIGSKSNDLAIARLVIEGKNEAERIREQIANVE
jgi:uncharacterized protein (TIGR00255 family)